MDGQKRPRGSRLEIWKISVHARRKNRAICSLSKFYNVRHFGNLWVMGGPLLNPSSGHKHLYLFLCPHLMFIIDLILTLY